VVAGVGDVDAISIVERDAVGVKQLAETAPLASKGALETARWLCESTT
jgi:hypothetical protein